MYNYGKDPTEVVVTSFPDPQATVTLSLDDFDQLRKYKNLYLKLCRALSNCYAFSYDYDKEKSILTDTCYTLSLDKLIEVTKECAGNDIEVDFDDVCRLVISGMDKLKAKYKNVRFDDDDPDDEED